MTLADLFDSYGVTQHDLVVRLSLHRQYASMLFLGQRKLGTRLAQRIHEEFGIPLLDLLYPESAQPKP